MLALGGERRCRHRPGTSSHVLFFFLLLSVSAPLVYASMCSSTFGQASVTSAAEVLQNHLRLCLTAEDKSVSVENRRTLDPLSTPRRSSLLHAVAATWELSSTSTFEMTFSSWLATGHDQLKCHRGKTRHYYDSCNRGRYGQKISVSFFMNNLSSVKEWNLHEILGETLDFDVPFVSSPELSYRRNFPILNRVCYRYIATCFTGFVAEASHTGTVSSGKNHILLRPPGVAHQTARVEFTAASSHVSLLSLLKETIKRALGFEACLQQIEDPSDFLKSGLSILVWKLINTSVWDKLGLLGFWTLIEYQAWVSVLSNSRMT